MKVCIINSSYAYARMFKEQGWEVVASPDEADLLQFTGGEDVSPYLYHQGVHNTTYASGIRDEREQYIFQKYVGKVPMAGICRGGQFLNVMNKGSIYQDVDNHAIGGTHGILTGTEGRVLQVTSTHHQMMRPNKSGKVLATCNLTTYRDSMPNGRLARNEEEDFDDVEVVLYEETKCLCFQPHPEFERAPKECTDYYFELIGELL